MTETDASEPAPPKVQIQLPPAMTEMLDKMGGLGGTMGLLGELEKAKADAESFQREVRDALETITRNEAALGRKLDRILGVLVTKPHG